MGTTALGSFHIGKWKASDLRAFTLHVSHLRTKLHLTSAFQKLIETVQLVV